MISIINISYLTSTNEKKESSNPYKSYDVVTVRSLPHLDFLTQLSELEIENFIQLMEGEFLVQD